MLHQEKKTMIREMIKIIFIGWKNISWVAVEFNVNVTNALKKYWEKLWLRWEKRMEILTFNLMLTKIDYKMMENFPFQLKKSYYRGKWKNYDAINYKLDCNELRHRKFDDEK